MKLLIEDAEYTNISAMSVGNGQITAIMKEVPKLDLAVEYDICIQCDKYTVLSETKLEDVRENANGHLVMLTRGTITEVKTLGGNTLIRIEYQRGWFLAGKREVYKC